MYNFRPIKSTEKILDDYKSYILSTFHTDSELYNDQIERLVNGGYEFLLLYFLKTIIQVDKQGISSVLKKKLIKR